MKTRSTLPTERKTPNTEKKKFSIKENSRIQHEIQNSNSFPVSFGDD